MLPNDVTNPQTPTYTDQIPPYIMQPCLSLGPCVASNQAIPDSSIGHFNLKGPQGHS